MAAAAFQNFQSLKETMHARLTTASLKAPSMTPAKNPLASSSSSTNPTSWKDFTLIKEATTIIGQAMKSLVNTVGQTLVMEDFPEDVDGVYLTTRILVMGPVRKKFSDKDRFRNDVNAIREMVNSRHGGFNHILCFDFAPSQSLLDCDGMRRAVVQFDLDRPTVEVLREACAAVVSWLDMDDKNVAILTCTNGIKSTCLVAACVYAELNDVPIRQGLCKFFEERMQLKKSYGELLQKLPPSYDRLLKAYDRETNQNENLEIPLELHAITLQRVPFRQPDSVDHLDPKILIRSGPTFRRLERVIQSTGAETKEFDENEGFWRITFKEPLIIQGDVTLDISIGDANSDMILFSFPFPVGTFDAGKIRFGPDAMDEVKRHILPADFSLEMQFEEVERLVEDASFARAQVCGKELCSLRHIVRPSKHLVHELMSNYEVEEREAAFALQRSNNDLSKAIAILTKSLPGASESLESAFSFSTSSSGYAPLSSGGQFFAQQENQTQLPKVRKGVLAKVDENSAQKKKTKKMMPLPNGVSSGSGMTPTVTPAKRRLELMEEEDQEDPTLSPFLRETIGKGLSSPITPARPLGSFTGTGELVKFDEDAVGEMDKVLLAQLAQLLQSDSTMAQKVEKLAEGKATIVLNEAAVENVQQQPELQAGTSVHSQAFQTPRKGSLIEIGQAAGEGMLLVPASALVARSDVPATPAPIAMAPVVETAKAPVAPVATAPVEPTAGATGEPTIGQHENYGVFFKMLKMGVPRDAVEQKMKRDGFIIKALDLGASAPVSKLVELERESQKTVGQDETYSKYFKMLRMGVPHPAVQQRMVKDGCLPEVLDLGENAPISKLEELIKNKTRAAPSATKKKIVRQKTIRWDAIPEERLQKGLTIWHHEGVEDDDLQLSNDLESLFIRKPDQDSKKSSGAKDGTTGKGEPAALKKKSFLDARRAQSVCIGIAKLKMTGEEYVKALNTLDEQILSSRVLQVIQGCNLLPSSEEATFVIKQKQSHPELAEPDEFLYQIAKFCPDAAGRIEALTFRYLFEEIAQQTKDDADRVSQACEQVRNSQKLKDLLRVVLLVGNQINSRAAQSDEEKIRAFTLNSLLKLSQTKSLNKTTTVLEYLVGFLMNKMPQVLDVAEELSLVNVVKRIDLAALARQIRDMRKGLDAVSQAFKDLEQFCVGAYTMMESVDASLNTARQSFESVLAYFGEDNAMASVDFFNTLTSFLVSFAHTRQELVEREKRNARKRQQAQQQAQQAAKKAAMENNKSNIPTSSVVTNKKQTEESARAPVEQKQLGVDSQGSTHPHLAEYLRNL